jgi:hypothetical protein
VKLHWKFLKYLLLPALMLVVLTGCGGINASHSVSPASFFLPGILKAEPKDPSQDITVPPGEPVQQVAQVQ